ncbi:hypothetical protein JOC95_002010 [Bacillus tianshenii]|uniref:Protein NO VEIN C-terminal domain-containing protein n=1 Tax=Sutcliffiella tianshenii TaxID=1463404 RepID=A0ABS2NZL9_9BACI|nr:hypothetical protein [Bacillus tianshenii]MBM7620157.1 hypothetical protein [Bacillus tianshenii]
MNEKYIEVFHDLKILIKESDEDYKSSQYSSYNNYIDDYNMIVQRLDELNYPQHIEFINDVPEGQKAEFGVGTKEEIAKHKEVIFKAQKLLHRVEAIISPINNRNDSMEQLQILFSNFHKVARQLRNRYDNRPTLDVNDEYDVQDLLHSLLKLHFEDVRVEEWTPSYAGGSKRMDFLLKNEKTVIEVKKTRNNLADKKIGEQLLIDIETYKMHTDCNNLVCFVYDPEGRIGNPIGLENDLSSQSRENLSVKVFIFPK